jgi:transposase
MGLGNDEEEDNNKIVDEGNKSFGSVSCSICLEVVTDNGDRSFAKLLCGHQFHLGINFFYFLFLNACKFI